MLGLGCAGVAPRRCALGFQKASLLAPILRLPVSLPSVSEAADGLLRWEKSGMICGNSCQEHPLATASAAGRAVAVQTRIQSCSHRDQRASRCGAAVCDSLSTERGNHAEPHNRWGIGFHRVEQLIKVTQYLASELGLERRFPPSSLYPCREGVLIVPFS